VLFAWLLLAQLPTGMQLVGGVLIIAGVALVRIDELRGPVDAGGAGGGRAVSLRPATDPVDLPGAARLWPAGGCPNSSE